MHQDALVKALITRTRQTPEGPIVSPLDVKTATENRDSLSKILYSKVLCCLLLDVACASVELNFAGMLLAVVLFVSKLMGHFIFVWSLYSFSFAHVFNFYFIYLFICLPQL